MNQLIVRKLRKRLTWLMHILNIKIIRWLYQCPSLCVAYSRSIVYQLQVNRSRKCQKLEAGALTTYTRRVWIVTGEKFPQAWWLLHLAGFFLSLLSRKKNAKMKRNDDDKLSALLLFHIRRWTVETFYDQIESKLCENEKSSELRGVIN